MKILVPVDGSDHCLKALTTAIDHAKLSGAAVCLISVVPFLDGLDLEISAKGREKVREEYEKRSNEILQKACGLLEAEGINSTCRTIVASASVPDAIIDYAESEKVDLIIIGSRGLSPSSRFRMGSVASKVVIHSSCSVYVVKI